MIARSPADPADSSTMPFLTTTASASRPAPQTRPSRFFPSMGRPTDSSRRCEGASCAFFDRHTNFIQPRRPRMAARMGAPQVWHHPRKLQLRRPCPHLARKQSKQLVPPHRTHAPPGKRYFSPYLSANPKVNSVAWAPHELGAILACASSDGKVSVLEFKDDGTWDTRTFPAHAIGCNAATWAPSTLPASLITAGSSHSPAVKRIATAGCDNLIKIWSYSSESNNWIEETVLDAHTDWVRDLAWAPNIGLPKSYLASASQDKTVLIWTQSGNAPWEKRSLRAEKFPDVVWRVSWSLSGNVLAVSCGDNKVTLWKENLKGEWDCVSEIDS
ncbi:Protein transport protein SEC13 [Neolecta irregularis DAH-3]|uniref:Protein transport protein SEC13 n=1 Tax=Neolecta irregularis (strain DAH-3) TaxID=1198029 RepID=A0A1U7LVM7_NEOID|nr:Protein transport protein SEC13 [Neolecta irregularis DAH-3]|eukprot:OLL26717.1 Protein transport protein SEC13 [Neolecta irregularis DAH-3]